MIRIAMGQMLVRAGDPEANLQRACRMIREAAGQACEVIVLPECMDLGWTYPQAAAMAQPLPGPFSNSLSRAARETGIYVVAGLTERSGNDVFNAAVLISPDGVLLSKHRKIHELEIAQHLYSIGDSLTVSRTPFGVVGVNICADNLPGSLALGHAQARMGAQILLSPSSWAVRPEHDNERSPYGDLWVGAYRTLAEGYDMPVIGVSNVGRIQGGAWDGWKCIGCSLAIGADGRVLAQGPYGEEAEALVPVDVEIVDRSEKTRRHDRRRAPPGAGGK